VQLPENDPAWCWQEIRPHLRQVVDDSTYSIWLAPLKPRSLEHRVLTLAAPGTTRAWVWGRFGAVLEQCAQAVLGADARVAIESDENRAQQSPHPQHRVGVATSALNPRYTFEQFIIGDGNRLAHAASLAVAELPGQAYNPLFLHAPPGLGKTHLLHAIGNYVTAFGGGANVRYATVEAFTTHFVHAISSRSVEHFKRVYRDADILLIDDVQFLASKAKTEEEFFHTFNSLYETGRQLVVTCDRVPQQLVGIEERLRERFEAGLVADIGTPDYAARLAILRKRAALDCIPVADEEVLELIAERVTDNVRALEGALIRVVAYHSLTGRPINADLANAVLDHIDARPPGHALSIADIQKAVASYYGVTITELISTNRSAAIAWPRQLAMHLARQLTSAPLQEIGDAFGGRAHGTVLHACDRVIQRASNEPKTAAELSEIKKAIGAMPADRRC